MNNTQSIYMGFIQHMQQITNNETGYKWLEKTFFKKEGCELYVRCNWCTIYFLPLNFLCDVDTNDSKHHDD